MHVNVFITNLGALVDADNQVITVEGLRLATNHDHGLALIYSLGLHRVNRSVQAIDSAKHSAQPTNIIYSLYLFKKNTHKNT